MPKMDPLRTLRRKTKPRRREKVLIQSQGVSRQVLKLSIKTCLIPIKTRIGRKTHRGRERILATSLPRFQTNRKTLLIKSK